MAPPVNPLQTIEGKVPREVLKAFQDLHQTVTTLKTQLAATQKVVATPPRAVTASQLTQIQQSLGPGGTHALFSANLLSGVPTSDPHILGTVWNNDGVLQSSQG